MHPSGVGEHICGDGEHWPILYKGHPMQTLSGCVHQSRESYLLDIVMCLFILCLCGTQFVRSQACRHRMCKLACLTTKVVAALWPRNCSQVVAVTCVLFHVVEIRLAKIRNHFLGREAVA